MAWYDYAIGRAHDATDNAAGGELGVDLKTPLNTVVTTPFSGVVTYAGSNQSTGGIVKVWSALPGSQQIGQYFLHLNTINVRPGQQVQAGQPLGLSGGEQPGAGGWAHVEYGLYKNPALGQQYWGFRTGDTVDPTNLVSWLHTTGGGPSASVAASSFSLPPDWLSGASTGATGLIAPTINISTPSFVDSLVGAFGTSAQNLGIRFGLIVLGGLLLLIGFFVLIWPAAKGTAETGAKFAAVAA